MRPESVCVIGLGLIGGSLARDLARANVRVTGYDADPAALDEALRAGVLAAPVLPNLSDARGADVVVIATPVLEVSNVLAQLAQYTGPCRLITDVCSTKAEIMREAEQARLADCFVGAHPFAGSERAGWQAAREDLFRDATVYLTPGSASRQARALALGLWQAVGARCYEIDAREHDSRMAYVSHLPQLIAFALGSTLSHAGYSRAELGRGGQDMTRLSGSDTRVWCDIVATNSVEVERSLAEFAIALDAIRLAVRQEEEAELSRTLQAARAWFNGAMSALGKIQEPTQIL